MIQYLHNYLTLLILGYLCIPIQTAYSQSSFLDCNKGGVYEINVQYQYGGKGKATEYKKMFYIIENGKKDGSVVLFELIPIEVSIPLYIEGGIKWISKLQYVIGNYCNHQWSEKGIILPQTKHLKQEEGEFGVRDGINKIRWNSHNNYAGECCPVSLYFYGKANDDYNSQPIRDIGSGIMPLNETSKLTSGTYTISTTISKVYWSEYFTENLYNLAGLLNDRFNHVVTKANLEYKIENTVNKLSQSKLNERFSELVEKYIKLNNFSIQDYEEDTENYYSGGSFDKPFQVNNVYNQKSPYPVITNKCYGSHNILYNFNNTLLNSSGTNIGRTVLWDIYKGGEANGNAKLSHIAKDFTKEIEQKSDMIRSIKRTISSLSNTFEKIDSYKEKINKLDELLVSNKDYNLPFLFTENVFDDVSKGTDKVIYDGLSLAFKRYTTSPNYTIRFTDTIGKGYDNPRVEDYQSYSVIKPDNSNDNRLVNQIKESIKHISIQSKYFTDSISTDLIASKELASKPEVEKLLNNIRDLSKLNSNGTPQFISNSRYTLIQFPEKEFTKNLNSQVYNEIGYFIDYILSSYKARRFRIDGKGNDYDLDDSDDYIERRRKIMSPSITKYCTEDEKYGAKIVSNMFFLQASRLPSSINFNMEIFFELIDDAEICEHLSELFGLDEDDIEDEFEDILKNKSFTLPYFTNRDLYALSLFREQSQYAKINKPSISESLINLQEHLKSEKSSLNTKLFELEKFVRETDTIAKMLANHSTLKTNYVSQMDIKFSNVPESDYSTICSFLTDYDASRGNNLKLYSKGKLREETLNIFKKVNGKLSSFYYQIKNNNATYTSYDNDIITYSPDLNNWIILNMQEDVYEDSCSGMGKFIGIGFGTKLGKCTIESFFIGGQPLSN